MADYRVAHQSEASGARGRRERHCGAVEVRGGVAAALALIAVMTSRPAIVHGSEVGDTIGHDHPAEFFADDITREASAAREIHRRQEIAVGHLRQTFARPAYADEGFDFVVVRREIFVAERPILIVSVATGGLELVIAVTIAFARPAESFAAN